MNRLHNANGMAINKSCITHLTGGFDSIQFEIAINYGIARGSIFSHWKIVEIRNGTAAVVVARCSVARVRRFFWPTVFVRRLPTNAVQRTAIAIANYLFN